MATVGVLARFEFKPGNEAEVESFFQHGKLVVDGQPAATIWFAFRRGLTTYGAFAVVLAVSGDVDIAMAQACSEPVNGRLRPTAERCGSTYPASRSLTVQALARWS